MQSQTHQWLVLWLARKMLRDGYVVHGVDGALPQGGLFKAAPPPLNFAGVRPDVWGSGPKDRIALGEAKTADDLSSRHTFAQFAVYSQLCLIQGVTMYVAIPRSAAQQLDRLLAATALIQRPGIVRLHIPDCFAPSEAALA